MFYLNFEMRGYISTGCSFYGADLTRITIDKQHYLAPVALNNSENLEMAVKSWMAKNLLARAI